MAADPAGQDHGPQSTAGRAAGHRQPPSVADVTPLSVADVTPPSAMRTGPSRRAILAAAAAALPIAGCGGGSPSGEARRAGSGETAGVSWAGGWVGHAMERGHLLRDAVSGAAAAPDVQRRAAVVVVGAGIAGLAAARALMQAGIDDVRVLDLDDSAGGNSRGHRLGGMACPLGAHYLPLPGPEATDVAALLDELGLRRMVADKPVYDERVLCHTPRERLHIDGAWHEGLLPPIAALPRAEQAQTLAEYRRFSAALADAGRHGAFAIPTGRAVWTPALSALDAVTFDAWLDGHGYTAPALRWYLDYCCRDDYGAASARVSAWAGIHYFASRRGFAAPGADTAIDTDAGAGDGVLTWPEGNGWLAARMAAPLAERLHTACIALQVRENRHSVDVDVRELHTGRRVRWTASQVVLAVPLFVAARLLASPPPALTAAAALVAHAPWLVGNLWLTQALDDRPGAPPSWDNVVYDPAPGAGAPNARTRPSALALATASTPASFSASAGAPAVPTSPTLGYVDAMHQSLRSSAGPTVLTSYWALGAATSAEATAHRRALQSLPWGTWSAAVVADIARVHPDLRDKLAQADLTRYGHAMAIPTPGVRSSAAVSALGALSSPASGIGARSSLVREAGSRIAHAHADLSGYSVFEEAYDHGMRAGRDIARRLAG